MIAFGHTAPNNAPIQPVLKVAVRRGRDARLSLRG